MDKKVSIIAEIGVNHNGSMKMAKKLVKKLSKLDIDYIKFQMAIPNLVYSDDAFKANYQKINDKEKKIINMSRRLQLTPLQHIELSKYCKSLGKKYACTAFDLTSLKFLLKEINIPFIKIPSGEILSYDLLDFISEQSKKIIISTGMSTFKEIEQCIKILNNKKRQNITILHCVSVYPANTKYLNLNVIDTLKKKFELSVGYSDHSMTDEAALGAIAKGAVIIEKHVTLNNKLRGPDHKASYSIAKFRKFVKKRRMFELMLGSKNKKFSKEEVEIKKMARKSIVSKKLIKKKQKISFNDICFKRPGTGISPIDYKKVIGKKTKREIKQNKIIKRTFLY